MSNSWVYKPVIIFGKRIYFLFAAAMSIPVWLATNAYMDGMAVHDQEAAATAVTMCFFAGIFTGRYLAEIWTLHLRINSRRLIMRLTSFIIICLCWLFIHVDFSIAGRGINLLLYWLPFVTMSLTTGILIKTVRTSAEKELYEARSSAAHSESELGLLQSKLSPHFLFNTLNNMYGLSLTQHEKIPPLLLRLSDLLRYSVYEANETFVPLKSEIGYINNYIEFEKIRLGERLTLEADITMPASSEPVIAPMLLIVFIENAFKHSKNTADDKITIGISLKTWNELILFSVENSHSRQEKQFDKNSGFGLDNVRKRLELLYPGAYKLDIREDDRSYSVALQIMKAKTV
jgi:sensor histidine kinase YesM